MNWKRIALFTVLAALLATVGMRLKRNKKITEEKVYHYDKGQAIKVQVDTLKVGDMGSESFYTGSFEPNKETKLSAEGQGKINVFLPEVGVFVTKGQRLIQLDDALLQQQLNVLNVQIQNIQAEYETQLQANQLQIDGLEADVKRFKILAASDAIQGVQLEKTELQLQTAQNQRKAILQQSALKNVQAQKETVLEQIKKTHIVAPFNGIVTAKLSEIGAFAAPGVPLLQLTDIAQLRFTINVTETELPLFKLNQSYMVSPDAFSGLSISGKVTMIGSKANIGNSFPIQFTLNNTSDFKLKAGMFGKVVLKDNNAAKGIRIPSVALQGSAAQPQVYMVQNGKVTLQNITIAARYQDKILVSDGLKAGDIIVTNGFINLFDGAAVN